jgi:hypothetical protein
MVGRSSHRLSRVFFGLAALISFAVLAGSASAEAPPVGAPIKEYYTGISTTQAGAHPDMTVDFTVRTRQEEPRTESGANQVKNALVETPAGFIGNPHAVPECAAAKFVSDECPVDAQVGAALPYIALGDGCCSAFADAPIYNLTPQPGQAGLLAWKAPIAGFPIYIVIAARTGSDYGLNAEVKGITANNTLGRYHQILWGVPASPSHDSERFTHGGAAPGSPPAVSNSPERPFLSNPTSCVGVLTSTLTTTAYDHGQNSKSAPWAATTGCDQLGFNPSLAAKPSTEDADSASGVDVILKAPQNESPENPTDSQIKRSRVTLPVGFSINPSAADGKVSCSDVQARFGTEQEAQCPEFSKVGTSSIDSWALPAPVAGGIYLGDPKPGDRYRVIVTADGFGTHIKLAGSTRLDPQTGQIETVFENLPQAPATEFNLHFFGSERGLFATPANCGTYPVQSEFEPWATGLPNQTSTQFFSVTSGPSGQPCPGATRSFKPGFRAAGASNGAGAHSPFSVSVTRQDGDQTLSTIGIGTPPGFTATLKNVPKCSDQALREIESSSWSGKAELANSKCPSSSQVGYSSAGAGAGSRPYYAPGKVYLTGPYKGAPLSFTVVTPAVSGPYDLGNVVNRVAVKVDPSTAAVTAVSDPLPQIVEGIPLRLRSVLINLDRKDFTLNPTNCSPFEVTGLLTGDQGAKAEPRSHFQVANCETLDFEPKLKTVVRGPVKRASYPALTATLTQDPSGSSNIAKAVVTLPHSEFLAQEHIRTICTRVQFAANNCPAGSIYGKAKAITPLLDDPVEGNVYLRASSNPLPDLVADLRGPASLPIQVVLVGKIDSPNQSIRTTFASIPDTPVSKFTLSMFGGKRGLLKNSTNICANRQKVDARLTGQSGATANQRPTLEAPCGKARKKAKGKKKRAAAKAKRDATKTRRAGR